MFANAQTDGSPAGQQEKDIIKDLMFHQPRGGQDIYNHGYWNGAMTVLSSLAPDVYRRLYSYWAVSVSGEQEENGTFTCPVCKGKAWYRKCPSISGKKKTTAGCENGCFSMMI